MCLSEALDRALTSWRDDGGDALSPRALSRGSPAEVLQQASGRVVLLGANAWAAGGEAGAAAWIFMLALDELPEVRFWAVVNGGNAYNYGTD